ncbi:Nramp family divalent metal transporter [Spongiivirga citrea]|uniref:Divalent metal cation transporter n=1 Tax=Spongiivirga citrea TaxID=1481457 RepID=A0A6M0CEX5_9FLAO|nr:Nramp family divalent metal transporter [Spongiivirga citrea]NER16376.1 divalent metal cation transporter [Spongiivirga citrea]
MFRFLKNIGPGPLVAAAFIGPGTVTVCSLAGVRFGYSLLWALVISIAATIILQEMAARLGLISKAGLSDAIRSQLQHPFLKIVTLFLIVSAIIIGNAAYEAGNVTGGVLGLETIVGSGQLQLGSRSYNYLSIIIGFIAFGLLYIGNYKFIERILLTLVILMSLSFLITAIVTKPDISAILKGIFVPNLNEDTILDVAALIGTTVVPYNLFLHASLVNTKWKGEISLKSVRLDTYVAIILGGLVSMMVVITATAITSGEITNGADLAKSLEPLFGSYAKYVMGIGLFAAGLTSAITAPLAAAYVAAGCFGWKSDLRSNKFRAVWALVLIVGILFSSLSISAIEVIWFAQIANGILLPVIAIFLLWIMNKKSVLGAHTNTLLQNILGIVIVLFTIFLGTKSILKVISNL